ncbi:unnamed protein product [Coffea canephora]|uniref:Ycf20-like protein n=1 Tax=Coffea canephora TaxID=49390 RepID=A0A068TP75_COFCA|nr:unnamed protein product [Coffea canephora]
MPYTEVQFSNFQGEEGGWGACLRNRNAEVVSGGLLSSQFPRSSPLLSNPTEENRKWSQNPSGRRFSMIARKIPSTGYPTSSTILTPKDPRSSPPGVYLGLRVNKTAFSFGRMLYRHFPLFHLARPSVFNNFMSWEWSIRSAADGDRLNSSPTDDSSSGTRLVRAIQAIRAKLETRIRELRKNFPMKLLFFLVGFYSATAFATVIGQTGDWDILSAALAVAVVEGIGALMYKASLPLIGKLRGLIIMFNYWKAGLSLGLFLDSFKY